MADIKNTFSKGLTALNMKTANFLEINKIKTYIATLNSEITALNSEIGQDAYASWLESGQVPVELLTDKLEQIYQKEQLIAEQEAEAARISEMEKQILGEQEPKGRFGAGARDAGAASGEPVLVCPGCGQAYDTPAKFCRKCGTRLN